MARPALGLVVNPVAGVGGPAALKGSDGVGVQQLARERGARPLAGERAEAALAALAPGTPIVTSAGAMGADAVAAAGLVPVVVHEASGVETTADDTRAAVAAMVDAGATLVLFAGGDGTARDVAAALGSAEVAGLGVPCGVKMYSPCFAVAPAVAGRLAADWLVGRSATVEVPVLDVGEDEVRQGRVVPTVFGAMSIPRSGGRTQARKAPTASTSDPNGAAAGLVAELKPGVAYLLGPGSTTQAVAAMLGLAKTPLGFDVIVEGRLVLADATEADLLTIAMGRPAVAVVSVIGGQGFLLGRGNQQLSSRVIEALADPRLLVLAMADKLSDLTGPLLIDTGDVAVDRRLAGYVRVRTGVQDAAVLRAVAAADVAEDRD